MRRLVPALLLALGLALPAAARADGDLGADSLYMVGEFVDPVCIYQHGMQGTMQRQCAIVSGRVEQGMFFLDVRRHKLYTVIGQNHWQDPKQGFLDALGDTFAVRARVWRRYGDAAIAITGVWPWRAQPEPVYRGWPWHWAWSVVVGCALWALLYTLALTRWRARLGGAGEPFEPWRAVSFAVALLSVLGSLNGPLHDLSDLYLFSTHMVQHLILAQVFPLLFALGIPTWLWRAILRPRVIGVPFHALASVPAGVILYTAVFSIWHAPPLYNLMMREHDFHIVMHLLVMATALLMWWPIVGGAAVRRPMAPGSQILYLFLLGTPMIAVATPLTFAQRPLYDWYALAPRFMGISAVEDQRLGGLIMWVPGAMFFWLVMSVVYFRWAAAEREPEDDDMVIGPMPEHPVTPDVTAPLLAWTAGSALALAAGGATWLALFPWVPRDLGGAPDLDARARRFRIPVAGTDDAVDAWYVAGARPAQVLVLHGFGREHSRSWRYADFMQRAGYGVLTIDFRSSRRRGNRLPTTLGHHELHDARAALGWLGAQPEFHGHRFAVFGESLGGAVAILAAAEEPRIAAVVVDCAFASGRHALEDSSERWARLPGWPTALLARGLGRALTGYDPGAVDVLEAAARLANRAVFFIHSLDDRRLSPRQVGLLWRAAGSKDPLWLVPGGHNEAWKRHPREYERRVLEFLEHPLAPPLSAVTAGVATSTWTAHWDDGSARP